MEPSPFISLSLEELRVSDGERSKLVRVTGTSTIILTTPDGALYQGYGKQYGLRMGVPRSRLIEQLERIRQAHSEGNLLGREVGSQVNELVEEDRRKEGLNSSRYPSDSLEKGCVTRWDYSDDPGVLEDPDADEGQEDQPIIDLTKPSSLESGSATTFLDLTDPYSSSIPGSEGWGAMGGEEDVMDEGVLEWRGGPDGEVLGEEGRGGTEEEIVPLTLTERLVQRIRKDKSLETQILTYQVSPILDLDTSG